VTGTDELSQDRPRSARAHSAILRETANLLDEVGFAAMTIEEVAARARAGKATIYRRWPSKGALAMDAVMAEMDSAAAFPDTGSVIDDFRVQIRSVARLLNRPRIRHMLVGVIFEAQDNPELREAFRDRYVNPRRQEGKDALRRGIARGELRAGFDSDIFFDHVYAALYFRLLISDAPLTRRFTDELVQQAFDGVLQSPLRPSPTSPHSPT
jgi:AcrR family transcriptional regulator